jgi:hypothetical protein
MTMTIYGNVPHSSKSVVISDDAAKLAGLDFDVDLKPDEPTLALRTLAAAFITACEDYPEIVVSLSELDLVQKSMQSILAVAILIRERAVEAYTHTTDD